MPKHLTAQQVSEFEEQGFLSPVDIMSEDEARQLAAELADAEARFPRVLEGRNRNNTHLVLSFMDRVAFNETILDVVEDVLGPDILLWGSVLFIKEPDSPHFVSWHQDGIFFARMGQVDEAVDFNTRKLDDSERRFPTFWGPGHDWVPDHNWGGSGMIGLQEMLMQTIGDEIRLVPAWPKDWDVDFKLHAPNETTVEGQVREGEVINLKVLPESRRDDVVIHWQETS